MVGFMARGYEKEREKNTTVFGKETVFQGVLEFTDNLTITGQFEGTIHARGTLVIAKSAVCRVDQMQASSITVEGKVSGNLEATDRVEMKSGSEIRGNVVTSRLRIADDVLFEGEVAMIRAEAETDIFSASIPELKESSLLSFPETPAEPVSGQMLGQRLEQGFDTTIDPLQV
ncbi:MAG: polymer-forming cytoskeletal protein [Spirochaetaceae bacterium]|jgi:cytoskeletal protein CcmA (bactofilin family)|nr:polymer-forming cytoskeletal protein [Spirochaetaceae bacterium]